MLTKEQYKILNNLADIKKHNSNKRNIKAKFQSTRYNSEDIRFLEENGFARVSLLGEFQISPCGEIELKNRY